MEQAERQCMTPTGMLAFDKHLFEADDKGKFKAAIVLDEVPKEMKAKIKAVAVDKWGENVNMKKIVLPYKQTDDDEQIEKYPFLEDKFVMNVNNGFEFPVVDRKSEEITKADIKGGDSVRMSVAFYPWEFQGKKGVGANVLGVQLVKEGKALYKKPTGKDIFGTIESENNGFGDDDSGEDDEF